MRFKEYLAAEYTKQPLEVEIIYGGPRKVFKNLEYWFDFGPQAFEERVKKLEQEIINAGGPSKFAMIVRRIPSVKHFLRRHKDEFDGDLAKLANLV